MIDSLFQRGNSLNNLTISDCYIIRYATVVEALNGWIVED